jgi:hypothetical protein
MPYGTVFLCLFLPPWIRIPAPVVQYTHLPCRSETQVSIMLLMQNPIFRFMSQSCRIFTFFQMMCSLHFCTLQFFVCFVSGVTMNLLKKIKVKNQETLMKFCRKQSPILKTVPVYVCVLPTYSHLCVTYQHITSNTIF